jgi:ferrous iron transport protein A
MNEQLGLDRVPPGTACVVESVQIPDGHDWRQRLEELGFLPGEAVMVMARGAPGGQPLAVRVGQSLFALRRDEAACVRVRITTEKTR